MNTFDLPASKPTPKDLRLYLDVDGVILGRRYPSKPDISLAWHSLEFLDFITNRFDCYWLTPRCKGDSSPVLKYLSPYFVGRPDIEYMLEKIKPTIFKSPRTDLLEGDFYWITADMPRGELEWLESRSFFNNWVEVDTKSNPDDLLKARNFLREELNPDV
jgi:hypothetical protein